MITRFTAAQAGGTERPRRIKLIQSAALVAAILAATAVQASTITGTVNTGNNPDNGSGDSAAFGSAPWNGPFPHTLRVGEFDFSLSGGQAVTGGSFSGNFGSNVLGSATGQANLFVDGVQLANCNASCETASQSADVAWSYTLTTSDLSALSANPLWQAGRAVITASQLSLSQVVLDPTSVSLNVQAVPLPGALLLLTSALAPLFGFARRTRGEAAK